MSGDKNLLDAALGYARRGWAVIPLHSPDRNGGCSCHKPSCESNGKHPRTAHGLKDATTDEATIRHWLATWPDANLGIATGAASDLVVIDVDPRTGGDKTLENLQNDHDWPDTVIARTGGGGWHFFFKHPGFFVSNDNRGKTLGDGLDIKADGGYIVAPPSLHASSNHYEWESLCSPDDLEPASLPDWLLERLTEPIPRATGGSDGAGEPIPKGQRNATLTSLAGSMRRRGMTEDEIFAALLAINENRCDPPLAETEVQRIAASVARYQPDEPVTVCLANVNPETVAWLWHPYIPQSKLTLLEGDPGVGKSYVTLAIATGVGHGHGLPGTLATEPGNVLLASAEDGLRDTIRPRLDALGADVWRIFALETAIVFDDAGLMQLEASIIERQPTLVIIDPLVAYIGAGIDLHRANETRSVMASLAAMAERRGCAILCVRHLTKSNQSRAIYRGIGSIDLTAACRSVLLAGCDPDQPARRAVVPIKNNLAEFGKPVGYSIEDGKFYWLAESDLTAEKILSFSSSEEERTALADAEDFLRQMLANGAKKSEDIHREARKEGISERTLWRAKGTLGVKAERRGESGKRGAGEWYWNLVCQDTDLVCQEKNVGSLNPSSDANTLYGQDLDLGCQEKSVGSLNQSVGSLNRGWGEI